MEQSFVGLNIVLNQLLVGELFENFISLQEPNLIDVNRPPEFIDVAIPVSCVGAYRLEHIFFQVPNAVHPNFPFPLKIVVHHDDDLLQVKLPRPAETKNHPVVPIFIFGGYLLYMGPHLLLYLFLIRSLIFQSARRWLVVFHI
jgi:hypothetical protein